MKAVGKVDSKGRISIPKRLRDELGLSEGSAVSMSVEGRRLVIEPLGSAAEGAYGTVKVEAWPEDLDSFLADALRRWWESRRT